MEKSEIKKLLYREKPKAILTYIRENNAYYVCKINDQIINFEVPVKDMGTADFLPEMEGQLLNRWIL